MKCCGVYGLWAKICGEREVIAAPRLGVETKTCERSSAFPRLEDLASLGGYLQSQQCAKHLHLSPVVWV